MEVATQQPFVKFNVLVPTIEPDDDLELQFLLYESDNLAPSDPCSTPILIPCNTTGIQGEVTSATLIWRRCSSVDFIDVLPENIEIVDGKTISIFVIVEDIYQSNVNDFELQVELSGKLFKIARGRIYL